MPKCSVSILLISMQSGPLARWTGRAATGSEIRRAAQRVEDVSNIVGRFDTFGECGIPPVQDALNDFDAREVDILDCGLKSALADGQARERGFAVVFTVEIGRRAQYDDPAKVNESMDGGSQQCFQRGVVLFSAVAIQTRTVGEEFGGVLKGLAKELSGPVDIGRGYIACKDGGGLTAGFVCRICGVMRAVFDGGIRVIQLGCFGESDGDVAESLVDFKHLGSVDILRVCGGKVGPQWEISENRSSDSYSHSKQMHDADEPGIEICWFFPGI